MSDIISRKSAQAKNHNDQKVKKEKFNHLKEPKGILVISLVKKGGSNQWGVGWIWPPKRAHVNVVWATNLKP